MEPYTAPENYKPTDLIVSKLRFYSAGIVASNKKLTEKTVECCPIEDLNYVDGNLSSQQSEYKAKAVDGSGGAYETELKTTVTINATWLSLSCSNRITAPDVRRGELVMLYQFGDADKYYWTTLKEDIRLRKLETVIYAFSATQDESKDATSDTTYYLEISTHKKIVHFHTSKADGEPFAYDIQLNTKEGFLAICDDVGNFISFDSTNRRLEMKNIDGSHLDINKKDIVISSVDSITLQSKNIIQKATNHDTTTTTQKIKANDVTTECSSFALSGSSSVVITAPSLSIN